MIIERPPPPRPPERYRLTLVSLPSSLPIALRLRQALKYLARVCALRVVSIEELSEERP